MVTTVENRKFRVQIKEADIHPPTLASFGRFHCYKGACIWSLILLFNIKTILFE